MKNKLAIFDMDETLVSSDFTWDLAAGRFLDRCGIEHDRSIDNAFSNHGVSYVISKLRNEYEINLEERDLFQALTEETLDDYNTNVSLKGFARETVSLFRDSGYFTCVLSANSPLVLNIIKNRFPTELEMDAWFSTRELPWSKGDSRVFDLVASYFGLQSKDCILIDDAEYAIASAEKIGMDYIRLVNKKNYNGFSPDGIAYASFADAMPKIKEFIGL